MSSSRSRPKRHIGLPVSHPLANLESDTLGEDSRGTAIGLRLTSLAPDPLSWGEGGKLKDYSESVL